MIKDFLNLIRERKWDMIVVLVLLSILSITTPLAAKAAISGAIQEESQKIREEMSIYMSATQESLKILSQTTTDLNNRDFRLLQEQGLGAYKKFDGLSGKALIDKLEGSTQNAVSAKLALQEPKIYDVLFQVNRQLTLELVEYFNLE